MDRYDLFLPFLLSFVAFFFGYVLLMAGVNLNVELLFYLTSGFMLINTLQYLLQVTALRLTLDSMLLVMSFYVAILFTSNYPLLHTFVGRMLYPLLILTLWATVVSAVLSLRHNSK